MADAACPVTCLNRTAPSCVLHRPEAELTEAGRHLRTVAAGGSGAMTPWAYTPCAREHRPGRVCILPDGHPVDEEHDELDELARLIDQHDNSWQHGIATDEQWHYRIARAILNAGWTRGR
jgi:hypothetical protein